MKKCESCKNCWSPYVCPQTKKEIEDRTPCKEYKEYPKGITAMELIKILEKLPQDMEIKVEAEGLFAVKGATYAPEDCENTIFLKLDLIGW